MKTPSRKNFTFRVSPLVLAIAATMQSTGTIHAAESTQLGLEEVIIFGQKREENSQEVPMAITAITSEAIERAGISSARDVTARIPNVTIVESLSPSSTYIISRGIASTRNSEPSIAVVIDGVPVGSATELSQSFYDVEQMEFLKGPQGSLYGRNALGGALVVTSKKPTDETEGRLSAGVGDGGLFELNGALSGAIVDDLYYRISLNHRQYDGAIENKYLTDVVGISADDAMMDFEESNDIRAQLHWEPSDSARFKFLYAKNDLETGAMWYRNIYRLESDPNVEYEFPINSNGNPVANRDIDTFTFKADFDIGSGTLTSLTNSTDTYEQYGVADETRFNDRTGNVLFYTEEFVDDFISGLGALDQAFFSEQLAPWAAGNFVGSDQYYDVKTASQEIRYVSDSDKDFRYITGVYAIQTERYDTIRNTWELPTGTAFDCEGSLITDFSTCSGLINSTENSQDNLAWAVFLNTDYDIADSFTLTLAARYDQDQREVTRIDGPTVDTFGNGVGAAGTDCDSTTDSGCAASGSKLSETFSAFQPKASLAYKPSEDTMIYSTYARGFRSGGFNASGSLLTDKYEAETLDSFEIGTKTTKLDGRLRTNAALFYQKYKNAQQFEFDGNVFVQSLYNIPESKIYGIEATLDFAATDNLTLSAGFGLMESEITEFDTEILNKMTSELNSRVANEVKLPEGTQEAFDRGFEGSKLPMFAHTTANIGILHELPLGLLKGRNLVTRVDYNYSDDLNWWIDGQDVQKSLSLVDASIGLEVMDNLDVQLWCKNCTDVEYDSEFGPNERELFGGAAKDVAYQARLRTLGLKATYRF
ncbi:MAG: iron complex outermembrane receptor protein [Flavobacteriales bacterium]|jgi:iron complex outermembrane receptor protein